MADLFFPQLSVGAIAQYPVRKTRTYRTIRNTLPDGRLILLPDPSARRVQWELSYSNVTVDDIQALQNHYRLCQGPLQTFTFLDPTGNLFTSSEDLTAAFWLQENQFRIEPYADGSAQTRTTFRITNESQALADLYQALNVPSNYNYSLSMYVKSYQQGQVDLFLRGTSSSKSKQLNCGPSWTRICVSSALQERGVMLQAGFTLMPGQQIDIYGLQLEPQLAPSEYRPTGSRCAIYPAARYSINEMLISADAPGLYSTSILVESGE